MGARIVDTSADDWEQHQPIMTTKAVDELSGGATHLPGGNQARLRPATLQLDVAKGPAKFPHPGAAAAELGFSRDGLRHLPDTEQPHQAAEGALCGCLPSACFLQVDGCAAVCGSTFALGSLPPTRGE